MVIVKIRLRIIIWIGVTVIVRTRVKVIVMVGMKFIVRISVKIIQDKNYGKSRCKVSYML